MSAYEKVRADYQEKFGAWPRDVMPAEEEPFIRAMKRAIKSGKPIKEPEGDWLT